MIPEEYLKQELLTDKEREEFNQIKEENRRLKLALYRCRVNAFTLGCSDTGNPTAVASLIWDIANNALCGWRPNTEEYK